jgi:hypothetical protein
MKIQNISNTKACPVSLKQVDKHLIKLYSSFVLLVLSLSLITDFRIVIYLITLDFFIRVFIGIKYSPLCIILTKSLKITTIKPVLIDSGRKKIAAQIGFSLSIIISFSYLIDYSIITYSFTSIFIFAIALDLIFDYCLACKMQSIYLKFFKLNN